MWFKDMLKIAVSNYKSYKSWYQISVNIRNHSNNTQWKFENAAINLAFNNHKIDMG